MKTVKFKFYQVGANKKSTRTLANGEQITNVLQTEYLEVSNKIELIGSVTNKVILGTVLTDLVSLIKLQKGANGSLFDLSLPIEVQMKSGKINFDTYEGSKKVKIKMKTNSTNKSLRKFCQKVYLIYTYVANEGINNDYDKLLEQLSD